MKHLGQLAVEWAIRCFGAEHVHNPSVRALRVAEEAVELLQSYYIPREQAHLLVDIVYDRPQGSSLLELQGVLLTTCVLAWTQGYEVDDLIANELSRVLSYPPEKFAKRNQEKIDLGMDVK